MQNKQKLGVVIGRFQPLHEGHLTLLHAAESNSDKVVILIGSANRAPSIRNPWSYSARKKVIIETPFYIGYDEKIDIYPVNDYLYDDAQWISDIQLILNQYSQYDITFYGHTKHDTQYLQWFGANYVEVESQYNIDGTSVRNTWFEQGNLAVPATVIQDYKYYCSEQLKFKDYPYPETLNFMCADSVVTCFGHVLLIKRKHAPGAGTWALPGGFKNNNETFQECSLRELREETNLRVPEKVLRGSVVKSQMFDHPKRSNGIPRVTMAFYYSIAPNPDGSLPRANASDDAAETAWVELSKAVNSGLLYDDHSDIIQSMTGVKALPAHISINV